jgi:hypothetical protein
MPDGTYLGGSLSSNLFASFDARWPTVFWQGQIRLAAQTWAQYTNLNFAVVPDYGLPFGAGDYEQGDPQEADIRIGGFNFGTSDLGAAWFPPPGNNYSVAGEVFFNTAQPFNIGSTYDLYTVAVHEFGHALGLLHSTDYYAAMYPAYVGVKSYGLSGDDIAGIRSLYSANGPRSPDGFGFYTGSFQAAADLTGGFDPVTQTLVGSDLDITDPGQAEYYRFLAPYGTSSQMTVTVQSAGLSLLSPFVLLYNAYGQPIAAASGFGHDGTTVSVTVQGVVPTQLFWLRVSGADGSPFGTGRYALIINFGSGPSPTVAPANTATPNGIPLVLIGGDAEQSSVGQPDDTDFPLARRGADGAAFPWEEASTLQGRGGGMGMVPGLLNRVGEMVLAVKEQVGQSGAAVDLEQPGWRAVAAGAIPLLPTTALDTWDTARKYARMETGKRRDPVVASEAGLAEAATAWGESVPCLPDFFGFRTQAGGQVLLR